MFKFIKEHYLYLTNSSKYPGVDLLRAIAVCLVISYHFGLYRITYYIQKIGWVGVDLFFVLSGFLIGGMLIQEYEKNNSINFKEFYKRRFLRIYPIYISVTIITIMGHLFVTKTYNFELVTFINQFFIDAVFLQSYVRYDSTLIAEGTWSLVIEEFFYLFAPFVILSTLWISKKNLMVLLKVMSVIFLSGCLTRIYLNRNVALDDDNWHFAHSILPQARYDELVLGIIVAIIVRMGLLKKLWPKMYIIGCILFLMVYIYIFQHPVIFEKPYMMTYQTYYIYTILSFSFGCILLSVVQMKIEIKAINIIARISYCAYLVQFIPGLFIPKIFFNLDQGLRFIVILFLAYLLSLLIEYPFIRLYKGKVVPNQQKTSEPVVVSI
ncbi:acyltransferase family protein [Paenibacillus cymbidii]|uniref:acyltransferase family protein n=1 Tax=Paenibacillus cymbidii TaxID=1639034 RepID=UPI0010804484|nr:acyltransferase [Paenibacillus cymbidii]